MKKIKLFEEFVNERMGVPDAVLPYLDPLADMLLKASREMAKGLMDDEGKLGKEEGMKRTLVYRVPHVDPKFPLKEIRLTTTIGFAVMGVHKTAPAFDVAGSFDNVWSHDSGGYFCNITCEVMVNAVHFMQLYKSPKTLEPAKERIRSVMQHELTHAYEAYMRKTSKSPKNHRSFADTMDGLNAYVGNQVSGMVSIPEVSKLFHLMYLAAAHEVNARVAQIQSMIRNERDPHKRVDIIKGSPSWKSAEELMAFKADEFYKKLAKNVGEAILADQMENLRQMLGGGRFPGRVPSVQIDKAVVDAHIEKMFKELEKNFEIGAQHYAQGLEEVVAKDEIPRVQAHIRMHLKEVRRLEGMDPHRFLKYWEKKFHKAGKTLHDKAVKLTTY